METLKSAVRVYINMLQLWIQGSGPGGRPPPPVFRPNWGPNGRENFSWRPALPPYLRIWMSAPPPLLSIIPIIFLILICSYEKDSRILFLVCFLLTFNLSDLLLNSALIRAKGFKELTFSPTSPSCFPLVTIKQLLLNMLLFHHSCR